jgi:phosphatidylserine/phosphatidylglycerophosphate/cardiolipin synthase-like enzyme
MGEVYAALENEDEVILGIDSLPQPLFKGYAVFAVRDGVIDSLPGRARDGLKAAILEAAGVPGSTPAPAATGALSAAARSPSKPVRRTADALFDHDDLILDGAGHRAALESILGRARQKVFIHSTFVSPDGWNVALPMLLGAASRGVKVQVFWGQADDPKGNSSSRDACEALRAAISNVGRSEEIVVHLFTTGSHAKLLIADDGQGGWSAVVGSCNWLSTDFESFDASLRMRDPAIVGETIGHLASLSVGSDGLWNRTAGDLTMLGRRIASSQRPAGRTTGIRVLLAADHADLVLDARDRSARRMLVVSHRFGIAGKPMTIIPALSAAQTKGVAVGLYYGQPTGRLSGADASGLAIEMKRNGVNIRPVHQPRLHAKVLAWDDDALAVTSLNWLSADPSETAIRSEIGLFVEMNKLADTFVRRFEHAIAVG